MITAEPQTYESAQTETSCIEMTPVNAVPSSLGLQMASQVKYPSTASGSVSASLLGMDPEVSGQNRFSRYQNT